MIVSNDPTLPINILSTALKLSEQTPQELHAKTGISIKTITTLKGRVHQPSPEVIQKLAKALAEEFGANEPPAKRRSRLPAKRSKKRKRTTC